MRSTAELLGGPGDETMLGSNPNGQPDPQPVTDVCNGQQGFDAAILGTCTVALVEAFIAAPAP